MILTKEQVQELKEKYREYYNKYKFCRKQYLHCENHNEFIEYAKKLDTICALDDIFTTLSIDTTEIEREVDKDYDEN